MEIFCWKCYEDSENPTKIDTAMWTKKCIQGSGVESIVSKVQMSLKKLIEKRKYFSFVGVNEFI